MTTTANPAIGQSIEANGIRTNYLQSGSGEQTVVLVHGSGPGVTAYANWRLVLPVLGEDFTCYAPDMVGFGYSDRPADVEYSVQTWADQTVGFMDAMGIEKAHLIGNSFGGAIALRIATQHPDRVEKLVLMGSMGVPFEITEGLDTVWGYEGTIESMRKVLDFFAYSRDLVNEELAQVRHKASMEPGFHESFSSMFPAPRQRWVEATNYLWISVSGNIIAVVLIPFVGNLTDKIGRRPVIIVGCLGSGILAYPYLYFVSEANLPMAFLFAMLMWGCVYQGYNAVFPSFFQELFPTKTRVTGFAVSQNLGTLITAFLPAIYAAIVGPTRPTRAWSTRSSCRTPSSTARPAGRWPIRSRWTSSGRSAASPSAWPSSRPSPPSVPARPSGCT
ncbi:MAG: alpha/beta fold hydrolase [Nakamurella multipartita]